MHQIRSLNFIVETMALGWTGRESQNFLGVEWTSQPTSPIGWLSRKGNTRPEWRAPNRHDGASTYLWLLLDWKVFLERLAIWCQRQWAEIRIGRQKTALWDFNSSLNFSSKCGFSDLFTGWENDRLTQNNTYLMGFVCPKGIEHNMKSQSHSHYVSSTRAELTWAHLCQL